MLKRRHPRPIEPLSHAVLLHGDPKRRGTRPFRRDGLPLDVAARHVVAATSSWRYRELRAGGFFLRVDLRIEESSLPRVDPCEAPSAYGAALTTRVGSNYDLVVIHSRMDAFSSKARPVGLGDVSQSDGGCWSGVLIRCQRRVRHPVGDSS